jgi:arginine decarboxylase-like protein
MPLASRSQKRLKFAQFPVCHRTFPLVATVNRRSQIHDLRDMHKDYCNFSIFDDYPDK